MKIIISCRTGQTPPRSASIKPAVPLKPTEITCAANRRKPAHAHAPPPPLCPGRQPVCCSPSFYLFISTFVSPCFSPSMILTHLTVSGQPLVPSLSPPSPHSKLPVPAPSFLTFPASAAVITPELETFDQPEPQILYRATVFLFTMCVSVCECSPPC